MSASSKKKLRKEQVAEQLTQKQLAAQKEASTIRLYTIAFCAVVAVLVAIAVWVGVNQTIKNTGFHEKRTTAVQIGDHVISNAELNYYYIDAVNNFYSSYGSYASMFGLDTSLPLDEQVVDEESGRTWADDFLNTAKDNAKDAYVMADAAAAEGYTLSEEKTAEIDSSLSMIGLYAQMYGYPNADTYLKALYGKGATMDSFRAYNTRNALASEYYQHHSDSLTYSEDQLRAKDAENPGAYSSFSYQSYYLPVSKFLMGGTTNEDGETTYTDAETAAAEAAAKAAAESLVAADITSVDALDSAIAALSINEGADASSTANENTAYDNINSLYRDWVSDSSRKAGDKKVFENTSTGEDGAETLNGCYVVYYLGANDNQFPLINVRHILVKPEHAESESEHTHEEGETYSDEELAAAKTTAQEILSQWKSGEATEESFAQLANEKSDDGDGTTGGLYENVVPGQMVANFNDWCFDSSRKPGDTDIVETQYGYHVMYFVGTTDITYRDYQIQSELRDADVEQWHTDLLDAVTVTDGDLKYIRTDLVLGSAS